MVVDVLFQQALHRLSLRTAGFVTATRDIKVEEIVGGIQYIELLETQRFQPGYHGHQTEWSTDVRDNYRIHVRRYKPEHNYMPGETHTTESTELSPPLIYIIERISNIKDPLPIASGRDVYH